jgi:hypothetical protein
MSTEDALGGALAIAILMVVLAFLAAGGAFSVDDDEIGD